MNFLHSATPCHTAACTHVKNPPSALRVAPRSFLVKVLVVGVAITALAINTRLVSWLSSSLRTK
jgi:hypothetical protein